MVFIEYQKELNEVHTKNQSLISDPSIDSINRKTKITSSSNNILNKQNIPNINIFNIKSIKIILTDIDTNSISNILSTFVKIIDVTPPSPVIEVLFC